MLPVLAKKAYVWDGGCIEGLQDVSRKEDELIFQQRPTDILQKARLILPGLRPFKDADFSSTAKITSCPSMLTKICARSCASQSSTAVKTRPYTSKSNVCSAICKIISSIGSCVLTGKTDNSYAIKNRTRPLVRQNPTIGDLGPPAAGQHCDHKAFA